MVRPRTLVFVLSILSLVVLLTVNNRAEAACASFPTDKGTTTSTVNVPAVGTYYIWSRNRTSSSSSNAYYLQVDNSSSNCFTVGDTSIPTNTWTWVNYQNGNTSSRMSVNLSAGSHTIKLYGVDPSLQVDKVLFTTDSACTPTGTGSNCSNSTTDPPPIVVPTNPNIDTPGYSGTISVGSGNNKTIVKIDGSPVASGTGQVTVDTTQLSDGYHTLAIESIDANGNKTVTYRKILVENHKTPWAKFYNGLYNGLGKNRPLTFFILGMMALVFVAFVSIGLYLLWYWKVWERIPFVNRVHLSFLHVPAFMYNLSAKLPNMKFPLMKTPEQSTSDSGAVVGGTHIAHAGTIHGNIFQRFFGHPGGRWFVVLGFALVGTMTALYSLAATTAFVVEPENGSLATATRVSDSSASGGSYLLFGTGSCPSGQTGTPPNCTTPPPATCPAGQTGTPPNCVTPPPPTTGGRPTRSNTGPRYAMTSMTADQFTSSGVCNRQRINGEVRLDGNDRGRTFTMTDCEINGNLYIMTGDSSTPLTTGQMVTFNMDYVDIINSIQTNSAVKFNVNHTFIGNQPQFTMVAAWSQVSGPFPATFSNSLFYQPAARCAPDQYEPCPQSHSESIHVLGFGSGMSFYNVGFELEGGSPFGYAPGDVGFTGIMNFHAANAVFDGCWFYAGDQVATYTIGYFDGPGNVVRNSAFDDRLGVGDFPGQQKATFINNRSIQSGAPYSNYP